MCKWLKTRWIDWEIRRVHDYFCKCESNKTLKHSLLWQRIFRGKLYIHWSSWYPCNERSAGHWCWTAKCRRASGLCPVWLSHSGKGWSSHSGSTHRPCTAECTEEWRDPRRPPMSLPRQPIRRCPRPRGPKWPGTLPPSRCHSSCRRRCGRRLSTRSWFWPRRPLAAPRQLFRFWVVP